MQGHNLASTIADDLEKLQEEATTTREELLGSSHRQNLIKEFRQAKMYSTPIFCSRLPGKSKQVVYALLLAIVPT